MASPRSLSCTVRTTICSAVLHNHGNKPQSPPTLHLHLNTSGDRGASSSQMSLRAAVSATRTSSRSRCIQATLIRALNIIVRILLPLAFYGIQYGVISPLYADTAPTGAELNGSISGQLTANTYFPVRVVTFSFLFFSRLTFSSTIDCEVTATRHIRDPSQHRQLFDPKQHDVVSFSAAQA